MRTNFIKNLSIGTFLLVIIWTINISAQDWWLDNDRYQDFLSISSNPSTVHLGFRINSIQRLFISIHNSPTLIMKRVRWSFKDWIGRTILMMPATIKKIERVAVLMHKRRKQNAALICEILSSFFCPLNFSPHSHLFLFGMFLIFIKNERMSSN